MIEKAYFSFLWSSKTLRYYYHDEQFGGIKVMVQYINQKVYSRPDIAEFSSVRINR